MFYIKKILEYSLTPSSLVFILLLVGLVLLYTHRVRWGKRLTLTAFILLLIISLPWIPNLAIRSLQDRYAPLQQAPKNIKYIVVLGGGFIPIYNIPVNNLLTGSSSQRLLEGIRLWHQIPTATLVFSGGDYYRQFSDGDIMTHTALMLGVPRASIIDENQSLDTDQEAILIKNIVKDAPFILVTSGYHMPRAMQLFENQGLHPIPAPCDFYALSDKTLLTNLPSLHKMENLNIAVKEYLGLAWNRLR